MKLFFLGIDGGCLELIEEWISRGYLPSFKRLLEEGFFAPLKSTLPPVTAPAWKCMFSGLSPERLGAFWWIQIHRHSRLSVKCTEVTGEFKDFWDYLGDSGLFSVVLGAPLIYPPAPTNGVVIAGGPDAEEEGCAYPAGVYESLKDSVGFVLHPPGWPKISLRSPSGARSVREITRLYFEAFRYLRQHYRPDVGVLILYHIVSAGHFLWKSQETLSQWQVVDEYLGSFLDEGIPVIVVSDHGLRQVDEEVNLAYDFFNRGLLRRRKRSFTELIKALLLGRDEPSFAMSSRLHFDIKTSRTAVLPHGLVYAFDEEAAKEAEDIVLSLTTRGYITGVKRFNTESSPFAPDMVVVPSQMVKLISDEGPFVRPARRIKADNSLHGFFFAWGPGFSSGCSREIDILDVAPTVLFFLRGKVPKEMEGKIYTDALSISIDDVESSFCDEPVLRDVSYSATMDEDKVIERLRDLGYID